MDCTTPGSFFISGCPPGSYTGYACNGSTYTGGQNVVLSLSHIVTFSSNKDTYNTGETIIPIFSADSDITVNCTIGSAVYTKTIPRSTFTISNLIAKAGFLAPIAFSSPNWVSSFSINTPGNYTFGADITRNPLTYVNDCNNAGDINIQKLASNSYGISPLSTIFVVKIPLSLKLK